MGIADFLFTPSVQRILGAVLAHPERGYTLRELIGLAASGRGGTQQQIERLLAAGVLVEDPRRGRQRCIRANPAFPLFDELRAISRKSFGLKDPLMQALEPFRTQIREAFVFGSVAQGTDQVGSDIDLAVIGEVPLIELNQALVAAESELGRPIHLSVYEPDEWVEAVAGDPIVAQIAAGPKLHLVEKNAAA